MPIEVNIRIVSDEDGLISDLEKNILASLSGGASNSSTVYNVALPDADMAAAQLAEVVNNTGQDEPVAEAPKRKRRTKAEIEAARAVEEAAGEEDAPKDSAPSSVSEDAEAPAEEDSTELDGDDFLGTENPSVVTIEQVVDRVAVLMKQGKQEACKALLAEVTDGSAKRVSQMDPKFIPAFVAGLEELEGK